MQVCHHLYQVIAVMVLVPARGSQDEYRISSPEISVSTSPISRVLWRMSFYLVFTAHENNEGRTGVTLQCRERSSIRYHSRNRRLVVKVSNAVAVNGNTVRITAIPHLVYYRMPVCTSGSTSAYQPRLPQRRDNVLRQSSARLLIAPAM